jgi:hypothetical protein
MDFKNVPIIPSELKSTLKKVIDEPLSPEKEVSAKPQTTASQYKQVILPMQRAQPSNAKMTSVTQVNKPRPARKPSKTLKVIRNDAPVKTLIGGEQHLFPGGMSVDEIPDGYSPSGYQTLPVKPMTVEKQTTDKTSYECVSSPGNLYYEFHEERRSSHIIIPPSESISILSFTPSFSFSLFSLPNQYKQRNDMVKDYINRVGKTQPRETSKSY